MNHILDLQSACIEGDLNRTKQIIESGFNINEILDEGKTAVCWSVSNGHNDLTRYLIEAGADTNFQEEDEGESVLIFAIQDLEGENMVSMIKLLLENGALVDKPDFLGWTPLIHATSYNSIEAVEILLSYGADPNFRASDDSDSALMMCTHDEIKALLKRT